eukprot:9345458-Lingulodinium_polyedra.AAC.1
MMRSSPPSAAATARKWHASHTPCERQFLVRAWRACKTCDLRAAAAAAAATRKSHASRTPCEHQFW